VSRATGIEGNQAVPPPTGEDADHGDKDSKSSPIDAHVGARIRLRRSLLGMSQERLGEALGLTFQQIQKYERGVNRVGASRLWDLARVLDVPVGFFFDDLQESFRQGQAEAGGRHALGFAEGQEAFGDDPMTRRETIELVRAYYRISDPQVRKRMLDLIRSLAAPGPDEKR
jgi:transcriptional regulator with XRE-family HTH domain